MSPLTQEYLVINVLALRSVARLEDVVIVTMIDDHDSSRFHHAGYVLQGQLLITLIPWEIVYRSVNTSLTINKLQFNINMLYL